MTYQLTELIDFKQFKKLMESYSVLTGISLAILDLDCNRLALTARCRICEEYHRKSRKSLDECIANDQELIRIVKKTNQTAYRVCKKGIVDMASPICLNGEMIALVFAGQFLLNETDIDFFKRQAKKYNFDEDEYIYEVHQLPIVQEDKILAISDFITELANMMVDTGYKQIQQLKHKEEIHRLEMKAVESQLNLLQSQINPHFIHNTLNTVSYLALKHDTQDIFDLISSFNILLRSSMSIENVFVCIDEELNCVKNYLSIQKYRYEDIFDFTYSVPDELKTCIIPKLILQPLVENSLLHGIIPKEDRGLIDITFAKKDQNIEVKVSDNGIGMKEDFATIINKSHSKNREGYVNIGLANVVKRLKLYFGEKYPFNIESQLGKGTIITFIIPLSYTKENFQCIR